MTVQSKGSKSYKKQNVEKQNAPHTGFKTLVFGHQFANADETTIPFDSLIQPSDWPEAGLVNPSGASLIASQLQVFKKNITVTSSVRGLIQKSEYIVRANAIEFINIGSFVNEVFEVEVADIMVTGNLIVDMQTIRVQGQLNDSETDFNIGYEFDVYNEEIIVFRDGIQMFRSDDNDDSGSTGNYHYIDDGSGRSSVIRFFEPAAGVEAILVATTGGVVDSANVSTFQQIENLQGQLDAIIPTVAVLAGVPESNFRSGPNNVDLKMFGDLLMQAVRDAGHIGDVKTSMLTEAQFQELHGVTWVLMDGRSVSGSDYETMTGNSAIPDARGQFLRGKNNGRSDGNQDPAGERSLGSFQNDQMQGHRHSSVTGNNTIAGGNYTVGLNSFGTTSNLVTDPITDGVNGTPRTGLETRSKNVAINYFIKINRGI